MRNCNKEQESTGTTEKDVVEKEHTLILYNDDHNTFEYVIETLIDVCGHTWEQAETCTWIAHYKGKCPIKSGSFDELKPYYDAMIAHHLYVSIQ